MLDLKEEIVWFNREEEEKDEEDEENEENEDVDDKERTGRTDSWEDDEEDWFIPSSGIEVSGSEDPWEE